MQFLSCLYLYIFQQKMQCRAGQPSLMLTLWHGCRPIVAWLQDMHQLVEGVERTPPCQNPCFQGSTLAMFTCIAESAQVAGAQHLLCNAKGWKPAKAARGQPGLGNERDGAASASKRNSLDVGARQQTVGLHPRTGMLPTLRTTGRCPGTCCCRPAGPAHPGRHGCQCLQQTSAPGPAGEAPPPPPPPWLHKGRAGTEGLV